MKVHLAVDPKATVGFSFQAPFPLSTSCIHCEQTARIAFVAHELGAEDKKETYVCDLHKNNPRKREYWLHDACAVAVYFCKVCLKPTALYNQA